MQSSNLILLVENNRDEVSRFEKAIRKVGIHNPFRVLPETDELKQYLRGTGAYQSRELFPLPALLLLNVDCGREEIRHFMFWLRKASPSKNLLVVGLSYLNEKFRTQEFYDIGMNAFFIKRQDVFETLELIQDLELLEEVLIHDPTNASGQCFG